MGIIKAGSLHLRTDLCIFHAQFPEFFVSDVFGAVAQLGERVNGIHEVEGSIPFSSTYILPQKWMRFSSVMLFTVDVSSGEIVLMLSVIITPQLLYEQSR